VAAHVGEPRAVPESVLYTKYTKVVLALLSGRSAIDVLDIQRAAHLRVMRE
jgi:hypothetical protein